VIFYRVDWFWVILLQFREVGDVFLASTHPIIHWHLLTSKRSLLIWVCPCLWINLTSKAWSKFVLGHLSRWWKSPDTLNLNMKYPNFTHARKIFHFHFSKKISHLLVFPPPKYTNSAHIQSTTELRVECVPGPRRGTRQWSAGRRADVSQAPACMLLALRVVARDRPFACAAI